MHQPAAGVAQHHKHEAHSKGCLPVLDQADRDAEHGAHDGSDEPDQHALGDEDERDAAAGGPEGSANPRPYSQRRVEK